ncbi:hypothetical protein HHI36_002046 [Cryptolaemus montrouzieri]|uniref:Protein KRI1 homolog n=1 Tax=Cryptolaemus montrouzieri TaxID=559131 RepID=A0ABD2P9G2_9CUCU
MLAKERPKFDPTDETYENYIDEYYKLDCEDIIDNIPCRFKYRKVAPNSFGLTIEEILLAKDRELNKWCSLKKAVQIRPDHVEKYDQIAFSRKGQNEQLKKKILPSLYISQEEDEEQVENGDDQILNEKSKVSPKNENERKYEVIEKNISENDNANDIPKKKKKKKKKNEEEKQASNLEKDEDVKNEKDQTVSDQKKHVKVDSKEVKDEKTQNNSPTKGKNKKRKKKKSTTQNDASHENSGQKRKHSQVDGQIPAKKFKKNKNVKGKPEIELSDARLAAYGLNPKKFKNKVIYGDRNKSKS